MSELQADKITTIPYLSDLRRMILQLCLFPIFKQFRCFIVGQISTLLYSLAMLIQKDIVLHSDAGRSFLLDYYLPEEARNCPVVIFVHGIRGFKDWGHWHLMAEEFARAGVAFVKFNFSHNGTTLEQPSDFADLEAYGQNNYTKELQDLDAVLHWVQQSNSWPPLSSVDNNSIALIGHSRGGGIGIIKAAYDERIKALITWAAVERLDYAWYQNEALLAEWKNAGVIHTVNSRTQQLMPMYYQIAEDFMTNEKAYSTELALQKRNDLPMLIIHGTADVPVPVASAMQLKAWKPEAELLLLDGVDHVFGGRHPWDEDKLGENGMKLCRSSVTFLKKYLL
jgi:uncharacterized protein